MSWNDDWEKRRRRGNRIDNRRRPFEYRDRQNRESYNERLDRFASRGGPVNNNAAVLWLVLAIQDVSRNDLSSACWRIEQALGCLRKGL